MSLILILLSTGELSVSGVKLFDVQLIAAYMVLPK